MPNRRGLITMTDEESQSFLVHQKTMSVATTGADGRPHLVAMWYCFMDMTLCFWTFSKSQKAVNLRRDPRLTILVESGETYETLRGVELYCTAQLVEDQEVIRRIGGLLFEKYVGGENQSAKDDFLSTSTKRVGVLLQIDKQITWDHTKLGGVY